MSQKRRAWTPRERALVLRLYADKPTAEIAQQIGRPSNGSEGEGFMGSWCAHCARDKPWSEGKDFDLCDESELCEILARSFLGPVDEWVYGDDGTPQCTAFVRAGDSIPAVDTLTMDMFVEERKAD